MTGRSDRCERGGNGATKSPSAPRFRMNAFCACENFDAFIVLHSLQPEKILPQIDPVFWEQFTNHITMHKVDDWQSLG